ncbi:MAG: hypothetical protein ACYDAR_03400, partial [Thermomicrobiales bacterium]
MFNTLAIWHPALGKEAEMLALGTEFVKARQARGEPYGLFTRLYSATGPTMIVARRFRDLAEAEMVGNQNRSDASFQSTLAQARALSREPNTARLREVIVPMNARSDAKYILATAVYPAPGNAPQVRSLLGDWVKGALATHNLGLAVDLYDPDGAYFVVNAAYPSLSAVEEHRRANATDNAFQEMSSAVSRL